MKISPKVKKAFNIATTVLVVIIVFIAAALFLPNVFGIKSYYVISGSMEPTIPTGSLIYVVDKDFQSVKVGDILTYKSGSAVVTHRAYEIFTDADGKITSIRTKGDANSSPDGSETEGNVKQGNLIGQTVFWIPLLGYIAYFVQTGAGIYFVIGLAALVILMIIVPDLLDDKDDKDDKGDKDTEVPQEN